MKDADNLNAAQKNAAQKINLNQKFAGIDDHWRPRLAAELNGQHVRLVKCKGIFPWHHHAEEDELFLVWRGQLRIELRGALIELGPGEMYTVRRGVEHRTVALEEAEVIVFEPAEVRNTGNMEDAVFTAPPPEYC